MKKVLLASVATIATASAFSAFAADLPSRKAAPVYAPPPPMWTGFYAGLNAGYGFGGSGNAVSNGSSVWDNFFCTGTSCISPPVGGLANSTRTNVNNNGFIGGGQVGYNYQWGTSFLIGLEADIQGAGIRGSGVGTNAISNTFNSPSGTGYSRNVIGQNNIKAGVDWLGTVRGRVGYLATPTMLVYATGGLSYGGVSATIYSTNLGSANDPEGNHTGDIQTTTATGVSSGSQTLVGWNAGGGVEWMFMPNWSLKAEAFYYDLGSASFNSYALTGTSALYPNIDSPGSRGIPGSLYTVNNNVQFNGVVARAGVNYHFNWGNAPVVASY